MTTNVVQTKASNFIACKMTGSTVSPKSDLKNHLCAEVEKKCVMNASTHSYICIWEVGVSVQVQKTIQAGEFTAALPLSFRTIKPLHTTQIIHRTD